MSQTNTHEAVRLADSLEDMTCIWSPSDNRDLVNKAAALLRRIPELEAERDGLNAARFAYASEFGFDEEGQPDVGSIHQNIRALKAERDRLRAEREKLLLVATGVTSLAYALGGMSDAQIGKEIGWLNKKALASLSALTPPNADQKGQ